MSKADISGERVRRYLWPDGYSHEVINPVEIVRTKIDDYSSIHRVTDAQGNIHELQPGWRLLVCIPKKETTNV